MMMVLAVGRRTAPPPLRRGERLPGREAGGRGGSFLFSWDGGADGGIGGSPRLYGRRPAPLRDGPGA